MASTSPPSRTRRAPGLTSLTPAAGTPDEYYRVAGFHLCGPRAVRIDMLERLADLIRVLVSWRTNEANPSMPPKGATGDGGFKATPDMMSILGCSAEELGNVLRALGFWADRRQMPAEPPAAAAVAAVAEAATAAADDADDRAGNCGAGRCAHPRSGGNRGDRDASGAGRRGGDRAGRERARHRSNPKRGRDGNAGRTGQGR